MGIILFCVLSFTTYSYFYAIPDTIKTSVDRSEKEGYWGAPNGEVCTLWLYVMLCVMVCEFDCAVCGVWCDVVCIFHRTITLALTSLLFV